MNSGMHRSVGLRICWRPHIIMPFMVTPPTMLMKASAPLKQKTMGTPKERRSIKTARETTASVTGSMLVSFLFHGQGGRGVL